MALNTFYRTLKYFRYTQVIPCHLKSFSVKNKKLKVCLPSQIWINSRRIYCTDNVGIEEPVKVKKKKIFIPRITLLSEKNEISIVTLEQAEKLATRRDMKLIKIVDFDTKTERPVYKLMNINDYLEEDAKTKAEVKIERERQLKEDKTISISSKIGEHDLIIKIKSIHKMFKKKHGVRVIISVDGNMEKANLIRDEIIKSCNDIAKVLSKSGTEVKLQLILRPDIEKVLSLMKQERGEVTE